MPRRCGVSRASPCVRGSVSSGHGVAGHRGPRAVHGAAQPQGRQGGGMVGSMGSPALPEGPRGPGTCLRPNRPRRSISISCPDPARRFRAVHSLWPRPAFGLPTPLFPRSRCFCWATQKTRRAASVLASPLRCPNCRPQV